MVNEFNKLITILIILLIMTVTGYAKAEPARKYTLPGNEALIADDVGEAALKHFCDGAKQKRSLKFSLIYHLGKPVSGILIDESIKRQRDHEENALAAVKSFLFDYLYNLDKYSNYNSDSKDYDASTYVVQREFSLIDTINNSDNVDNKGYSNFALLKNNEIHLYNSIDYSRYPIKDKIFSTLEEEKKNIGVFWDKFAYIGTHKFIDFYEARAISEWILFIPSDRQVSEGWRSKRDRDFNKGSAGGLSLSTTFGNQKRLWKDYLERYLTYTKKELDSKRRIYQYDVDINLDKACEYGRPQSSFLSK